MINNYPLFTVIIPQKNRAEYLIHTLKTCTIQDYPNFEIIVSDDCSEDNSVEVVLDAIKIDSRIKLFQHNNHLGMRDNFEFALSQVRPGYVIALGGDDGLVAGSIWKMYQILHQTNKELLTWSHATFCYPESDGDKNILYFHRTRKKGIRIIKSEDYLNTIAKNFFYPTIECPMFYIKGVASTNLVERVKSRTKDNSFYYCPTPDGFSGIVLAGEVEEYAFTYEPLSIGGSTTKSQGKNYHRTDEGSRKEAQQFFNDNIMRTMHPKLASQQYSPLVTLMTADYLLTAKDLPGWPGRFKPFSISDLIIASFKFIKSSKFKNEVLIRELKILREIAKQHNLIELFYEQLNSTRREVPREGNVYGFAITNSVRFEGTELGINNIYEASLSISILYSLYNKFSFAMLIELIMNTFKIIQKKIFIKSIRLPNNFD